MHGQTGNKRIRQTRITWLALRVCTLAFPLCLAAQTTASITVRLVAPDGSIIPSGRVLLENPLTAFFKQLPSSAPGHFFADNLPLQPYRVIADAPGFASQTREMVLRSNVPVTLDVRMPIDTVQQGIDVSADAGPRLLDTSATGTRSALSSPALEKVPVALGSRGVESYLLTLPGFAMNANGAIHPRGAHNQMTFVIDGMPVSDQLTGAFSTALDPNIVDSLELYTGDIPAEFGSKVSGVVAISTRTGAGSGRRFFGDAQLGAGYFDTVQNSTRVGGEAGRWAYFASISAARTHRFLDQVSLDNLHNGGNAARTFLRLDYQASAKDRLGFNLMTGRSSFQLANLRSQHAAGMDQRQVLRDASFWLRWNRLLNPSTTFESTLAYRPSIAELRPSAFDTPVTASQSRHLSTVTFANRLNRIIGRHSVRAGADIQAFALSEAFAMAITGAEFNHPASSGFNEALIPYDLSRGGDWFRFHSKGAGALYSAFVQDLVKWGRVTFSTGLRYDNYRFLTSGNQLQARMGLALFLKETRTVFRASCNRNYQTPPNENLLLSSSPEAGRLAPRSVRDAVDTFSPLRPQRENVFEGGVQQSLPRGATLNASLYHKNSRDQQDNNNFFDTGVIFPVTLARIRVNGAEGRLVLPAIHGITATLSGTHSRAVTTPPFTGGLFLGQDAISLLTSGPFVIDHDQKLSLQISAHYAPNRNWWTSTSVRYDSGLVANPTDPEKVAADPDYRDLLPYVRLSGDPPRVAPRTITDVALGYQRWTRERRSWDVQVQANNLFDVVGLYNFQSVFVGTRLVASRSLALKVRLFW